jgi:hypothetical protein
MKSKSYIRAIKILAMADIQTGKRKILENDLIKLIEKEDYETCQGINEALKEHEKNNLSSDPEIYGISLSGRDKTRN